MAILFPVASFSFRIRKLATTAAMESGNSTPVEGRVGGHLDSRLHGLVDPNLDLTFDLRPDDDPDITGCDDNEIVRNPIVALIG